VKSQIFPKYAFNTPAEDVPLELRNSGSAQKKNYTRAPTGRRRKSLTAGFQNNVT